jgi:hypothetical protein
MRRIRRTTTARLWIPVIASLAWAAGAGVGQTLSETPRPEPAGSHRRTRCESLRQANRSGEGLVPALAFLSMNGTLDCDGGPRGCFPSL